MDIKVKKRLLWATFLSIGFMVVLLWRVEWKHFSLIADRLNVKDIMIALSVFAAANLVRAFRFYKLDHMDNKLTHWWNINAFYNFMTATLPGGAGEAATVYVLKRFSMFNILGAFRILLLSRLMDLFAISAFFFISAILISNVTPYRDAVIWLSGALFFVSSVALIPASEQFVLRILQKLPGHITFIKKVCERLNELLDITRERRDICSFAVTLIQSILTITGSVVSVYLLLRSLGVGFTPVQSIYCFCVYAVFQIVPAQGVAGLGTQAAWWALALNTAGYVAPDAIALGFILHGIFYLFITFIGSSSMLIWLMQRKKELI